MIVFKVRANQVQRIWRREGLKVPRNTSLSFPKI